MEREGSRTFLFIKDATSLKPQVAELVEEPDDEEEAVESRVTALLKMQ